MCWEEQHVEQPPAVVEAQKNLSTFLAVQAKDRARRLGFGWKPCQDAPYLYLTLEQAFEHSRATRTPLPVSNLHSDNTIGTDQTINFAFRYWHDTNHLMLRQDFTYPSETAVADYQLAQLKRNGFNKNTLEYRLMDADSHGQNLCMARISRFPHNQRLFAMRCLESGFDHAIALESQTGK